MSYVDEIYAKIVEKNPAQPEFHQAVKEVLESLRVVIEANEEEYKKEALLERLSESGEIETAESIISRLYEMCIGVNIVDEDHRIKRKKLTNAGTIVN